ncbi:alpha/beta fold hydrolase [Gryllotalpicola protaetiae]|uniref:Alpha/beta hydrolase n=1 Tax=Gryllotalpicola protaetiae TaxID=2419771 RepID=A0A387BIK3_9MICO|nr:alpha/beta hydrolase [Gryllotalpicola protaetiae]AYG03905.1 alpha/beta hydrolase [Gryllotalpicola protaetiae]
MSATVLLVHGAFTDGASWNKVIAHLRDEGVEARTVANPLRGLSSDGEYVSSVVAQTPGDVVLVGHSYGGPVITYAASGAENVKALVFVGAFGIDKGESAQSSSADFPAPPLTEALAPWTAPGSDLPDLTIQAERYREVFAADVTDDEAAAGAVNQRPVSALGLGEPLAVEPAWRRLPSWWVLGTEDKAADPSYQRAAAAKVGAKLTELEGGSHSIALSRSHEVAAVILDAVHATV